MRARLQEWLAQRRTPWLAAALAVLLSSPAMGAGLFMDDHLQRARLLGSPGAPPTHSVLLELFVFFDGTPAGNRRLVELGFAPWWIPSEIKAAFFRPLAVLTHRLDSGQTLHLARGLDLTRFE